MKKRAQFSEVNEFSWQLSVVEEEMKKKKSDLNFRGTQAREKEVDSEIRWPRLEQDHKIRWLRDKIH